MNESATPGMVQGDRTPAGRNRLPRQSLRERVQELMDRYGLNQADLSEQTGMSRSVISQWLAGKYDHDGGVIPAMKSWVIRICEGSEDFMFVDLKNSALVMEACEFAMAERRIALVVGRPGLGKTVGLREFHRRQVVAGNEVLYHFVNPAIKQHSLAKMLCRRFELSEKATTFDLLESLVNKLRRKPLPLLFDESNHFNVPCLEALRYLYDQVRIPMVLCGSIQLQRTLSDGGDKLIELEQLQSRIGLRVVLSTLKAGETTKLLKRHWPDIHPDSVREFQTRSRGIIRDLVNGIENAKKVLRINKLSGPPDGDVIKAAFERQLLN